MAWFLSSGLPALSSGSPLLRSAGLLSSWETCRLPSPPRASTLYVYIYIYIHT